MNMNEQLLDAAEDGQVEKIKELLQSGANINFGSSVRDLCICSVTF